MVTKDEWRNRGAQNIVRGFNDEIQRRQKDIVELREMIIKATDESLKEVLRDF